MQSTYFSVIRRPLTAACLVAGLLAPVTGLAAGLDGAAVTRSSADEVRITWQSDGTPVDVYAGTDPAADLDDMTLISDDDTDGTHTARAEAFPRPYFRLVRAGGAPDGIVVAERVLPLEGGTNFRDLGGYETADGKAVKWGLLYRSGAMAHMTSEDYRYLRDLGISVICDFRSTEERQAEPTQWQEIGAEEYFSRDYAMDFADRIPAAGDEKLGAEEAADLMAHFYRDVGTEHKESYRRMFQELLAGDAPLAFNCSAGKDRTGVGAALLLTALGVPREQVIADYVLSNEYYRPAPETGQQSETTKRILALFNEDGLRMLMGVQPRYLEAALDGIDAQYGSIDTYFEQEMGIGETERAKLRAMLLQ